MMGMGHIRSLMLGNQSLSVISSHNIRTQLMPSNLAGMFSFAMHLMPMPRMGMICSLDCKQEMDKDPKRRLGAGLDGYAALKFHPFFFRGINWGNLLKTSAPGLSQESTASNGDGPQDDAWNHQSIVIFDRGGGTGIIASSVPTSEAWPVPSNLSVMKKVNSFEDPKESMAMEQRLPRAFQGRKKLTVPEF